MRWRISVKVFCPILTLSGYLITNYVETLLKLRMLYVYTYVFYKKANNRNCDLLCYSGGYQHAKEQILQTQYE